MTLPSGAVAIVTPRYAPAVGGVEHHVEMLARGLRARGAGVEVITTDPSGKLLPIEVREGVMVRRFPTVRNDGTFFFSPQLGWWLSRHAERFELIHAHSYHTPVALQAAAAAKLHNVPLVVTTHYHGTGHSRLRRMLHQPYRPLGRWMLRQAHTVICVSEAEQALIRQHFGSMLRTAVVPGGVDSAEILAAGAHQKEPGSVVVLAAGRLEHYKQTSKLIEALRRLPPNYRIVVVGDGPERPRIEQLVNTLGVADRSRMLGWVARHELLAWYRTADVFASLSRWEALGLTVMEAAAAGAAIIASDIPAYREVADFMPRGRVSFVSTDCSPVHLAEAIERAAHVRQRTDQGDLRLPTWEDTVSGALTCYRAALGAVQPAIVEETAK